MIHIRKSLSNRRGNYYYRDYSERIAETLCGAGPTGQDITDTKSGLAWMHEHDGCPECMKLAKWRDDELFKMKGE